MSFDEMLTHRKEKYGLLAWLWSKVKTSSTKVVTMKTCKYCMKPMDLVYCCDTGGADPIPYGSIAYNIFICRTLDCMTICRVNVWDHPGTIWIKPDNTTEFNPKE